MNVFSEDKLKPKPMYFEELYDECFELLIKRGCLIMSDFRDKVTLLRVS